MVELRYIAPDGTTTEPPILQYRSKIATDESGGLWLGVCLEWKKVPFVGVSLADYLAAK